MKTEEFPPTEKQLEVRAYVLDWQREHGAPPSFRNIQARFGLKSVAGAVKHVRALLLKKLLTRKGDGPYEIAYGKFSAVPLLGTIPAGMPVSQEQDFGGDALVDLPSFGIRNSQRSFRVVARGDSMIGVGILDGDVILCEQGEPKSGDVVAALIDGQCTLKTYLIEKRKPWLRAENPKYPRLIPAEELVIQGVMKGLVRVRK
jgi:repressor LexA